MKGFLLGIVVTLIVIAGGAYLYFSGGYAPVATSAPPMPFERKLAQIALETQIEKQAPKGAPIKADEAAYIAGAAVYKMNCAICHGLPGAPQTPIAKGEFPRPPQLFKGHGVTDDPAGETYWKIANGIRLSGMPGFKQSLSETQIWQVSLLLKDANKLPPSVQKELGGSMQMGPPGGGHDHDHDHDD